MSEPLKLKDETLWELSQTNNVARFISFDQNLNLRYSRISVNDSEISGSAIEVIANLMNLCGSVNIRTFLAEQSSGNPFVYGLTDTNDVFEKISKYGKMGYFCLVNETISVNDGGISGVVDQGIVEFSPDDTPRAVEKPGICALSLDLATKILSKVYGVDDPIPSEPGKRVEFSLHPNRVGIRNERVLVWESSSSQLQETYETYPTWPNNFSRHIGDKVFGLLIANAIGLPVPFGSVVGRRVSPFTFGESTNSGEVWIRTCPFIQEPGKYTTTRNWTDPFALMQTEDPENKNIQALIFQEGVLASFSGATYPDRVTPTIEGVMGTGEEFMSGSRSPEILPDLVLKDVNELLRIAEERVANPVRIEWVHDGTRAWVVQMHVVPKNSLMKESLLPEKIDDWIEYEPNTGISELMKIITVAKRNGSGVVIMKSIGITSHIGDLLRKNSIPFKLKDSL